MRMGALGVACDVNLVDVFWMEKRDFVRACARGGGGGGGGGMEEVGNGDDTHKEKEDCEAERAALIFSSSSSLFIQWVCSHVAFLLSFLRCGWREKEGGRRLMLHVLSTNAC